MKAYELKRGDIFRFKGDNNIFEFHNIDGKFCQVKWQDSDEVFIVGGANQEVQLLAEDKKELE